MGGCFTPALEVSMKAKKTPQVDGLSATKKPWGWELALLNDESVMFSLLWIRRGKATSFHCHPNKITGYIVLGGVAYVKFLSGEATLHPGKFLNLRPGLFHETFAKTSDCILLEIEAPPDKTDLIRLSDQAGRSDSSYEVTTLTLAQRWTVELSKVCDYLESGYIAEPRANLAGVLITRSRMSISSLIADTSGDDEVIVTFIGDGILARPDIFEGKAELVKVGNVISMGNLKKLLHLISPDELRDMVVFRCPDATFFEEFGCA